MSRASIRHEFVDLIPDTIEDGVLYVSVMYATALHLCCCGCRLEVVTPLSPTDWSLTFDGDTVSLRPSIGNYSFPCRSHYFIERNRIRWASRPSDLMIAAERHRYNVAKQQYYAGIETEQATRRLPRPLRWILRD